MNILDEAIKILYHRKSKKQIEYGDFHAGMIRTSVIASELSNKKISVTDCYNVVIALKFSRQSCSHKEDNLLDIVAYIASMNDFNESENNK